MFADSRFDYLSTLRYYAAMVVTPVHYVAALPSRAAAGVSGLFETRLDLQERVIQLEDELLMQRYQLQKLEHLTAENRRLNQLLSASAIVDERVERAQLIGESPDPYVKRILINKGRNAGAYVGQPVLDAYGLMGQVVEVEPLNSWVLLISDVQHATPVQVNRNGLRAIAAGVNDTQHLLTLNNIPNTADIMAGDILVTSGLGGKFPAGYPVGVVETVTPDPGQPFATVVVVPTAQIDRSRNLLLVFDQPAQASAGLRGDGVAEQWQTTMPAEEAAGAEAPPGDDAPEPVTGLQATGEGE